MRDGMVVAKTYLNETEAEIDRTRLEAMGIESWLETDNCDGMYPQLDLLLGVKILVREEDASQTRDLLGTQSLSVVDHPWECPGCGTHIEAGFDTCWKCGVAFNP